MLTRKDAGIDSYESLKGKKVGSVSGTFEAMLLEEDMKKWADKGVRFLLVGDPYQLPPVDKENDDDYSVFSQTDGVLLKTVMRSAGNQPCCRKTARYRSRNISGEMICAESSARP